MKRLVAAAEPSVHDSPVSTLPPLPSQTGEQRGIQIPPPLASVSPVFAWPAHSPIPGGQLCQREGGCVGRKYGKQKPATHSYLYQ